MITPTTIRVIQFVVVVISAGLLGAVLLFLFSYYRLQSLKIEGRDFLGTLRQVPITIPLALDLLDLALDFLGAPFGWLILSRLRLRGLRNIAVLEELIPGTQLIPLLTLSWLGVRAYDHWCEWRKTRRELGVNPDA